MWKIIQVPVLSDNYSCILANEKNSAAIVIDPGEKRPLLDVLMREKLELKHILNTHHHHDHIGANDELKSIFPLAHITCFNRESNIPSATLFLDEGLIDIDGLELNVHQCPGHTKNHIVFYSPQLQALFCGDVLFHLGCGRLFEGTAADLFKSLHWIKSLPNETMVYCGHEYTANNLKFCQSLFSQLIDYSAIEEKITLLREQKKPTIPFLLEDDKKYNPFFQFERKEFWEVINAKDSVDYLSKLRALKDSFS